LHAATLAFRAALAAAFLLSALAPCALAQSDSPVPAVELATFDTGEAVVRLSEPAEPLQFTVVPQPSAPGVLTYGVPLPDQFGQPWAWQLLPEGLIYRSYLAGVREPRLAATYVYEFDRDGWLLDTAVGARVGVLRYGTETGIRPDGFQADLEAAAFPRLDPESEMDLVSSDFRFGVPLTWGLGPFQAKLAYYHLSSHVADELLIQNPAFPRLNFGRDAIVLGGSYYFTPDLRAYAEAGWAFYSDGGSDPWEFQFGIDYSPLSPLVRRGAPFVALNGHLREEVDFGGNFVAQFGWQWRGKFTERLFRVGLHYLTGPSPQYQFFRDSEEQLGVGVWYDF
jgi:Protein of unknown function (DUF1207)